MADETLKLVQSAVRKRGAPISAISPVAVDMCGVIEDDTCYLILSQGKYAAVDPVDYERLCKWKWSASKVGNTWYAVRNDKSSGKIRRVLLHREIMNEPHKKLVDHHDHDGLNNRRSNLRIGNKSLNGANSKRRSSTSPYRGVTRHRGIWKAQITVGYRYIHLGTYQDPELAARAYDRAAKQYFGPFAVCNFSDESRCHYEAQ
jgi:hypothetical protein